MSQPSWANGLRKFLYSNVVPLVEPNQTLRQRLVDLPAMKIWAVAFTHQSYNPNTAENYESLEKIGDAFMKAAFNEYLERRYPGVTQLELSELIAHYLSKPELAKISLQLGLDKWVRTNIEKDTHMFEDLLEATFGALSKIGNNLQHGVGYILCYNLIVNLFNPINIDLGVSIGKPKTQLKQLFEKMHWGPVDEYSSLKGELVEFEVYLTETAMNNIQELGIGLDPLLGIGTGRTKTLAEITAYENALQTLNRVGITQDWADSQRKRSDFESPELAVYYSDALAKLRRQGFESMYFFLPKTNNRVCYVQLIGVDSNGRKQVLVTSSIETTPNSRCSASEGKKQALIRYINGK